MNTMVINHKENPFAPNGSTIPFEESSNLDVAIYSGGNLDVLFKSGQWYRYSHVDPGVVARLMQGMPTKDGTNLFSRGAAFYQLIRSKPHIYPYEKLAPSAS